MALIEKFTVETQMHMGNKRHNIDKNHIWSKQTNKHKGTVNRFSAVEPWTWGNRDRTFYCKISTKQITKPTATLQLYSQWKEVLWELSSHKLWFSGDLKHSFPNNTKVCLRLKSENIKDMNSGFNKDKFYNLNKCFFKVEEIIPHNTWSVSTSYTINIGIFLC